MLHDGRFYSFRGDGGPDNPDTMSTTFLPAPVQWPRVPIWVAGTWPSQPPFCRAARWDGVVPITRGTDMVTYLSPDEVRDIAAFHRRKT